MVEEFNKVGIQPDFLFSGRPADKYFDMKIFNDFLTKDGLTFEIEKGSVNYWKSAKNAKVSQFFKDVKSLDLSNYDVVISDYEPITSWAATKQKIPVIGIGHQYAFNYDIPKRGFNFASSYIMKHFARADIGVGLHWHHFNQPILPPIINTKYEQVDWQDYKFIVYLPFEDQQQVIKLLAPFTEFQFHIYSPNPAVSEYSHIRCYLPSREGFQQDLKNSAGVICNAGFELVSEALQLGKKILVKPVAGQAEQISNALALTKLNYGSSMMKLDRSIVTSWLYQNPKVRVSYVNVAHNLVNAIKEGRDLLDPKFIKDLWDEVPIQIYG